MTAKRDPNAFNPAELLNKYTDRATRLEHSSAYHPAERRFHRDIPQVEQLVHVELTEREREIAERYRETLRREGKALIEELEKSSRERNTFTLSEWKYFSPLFKNSLADSGLSLDEYLHRANQYRHRVDLYAPIVIMDDSKTNVITEIHPQFHSCVPLSDTDESVIRYRAEGDHQFNSIARDAHDQLAVAFIKKQAENDWNGLSEERLNTAKSIIKTVEAHFGQPVASISFEEDDGTIVPEPFDKQIERNYKPSVESNTDTQDSSSNQEQDGIPTVELDVFGDNS